jgi:hypothetical protein
VALHRPKISGVARDRATDRRLSARDQDFVGNIAIGAQCCGELVLLRKAGPGAPLRAQSAGRAHRCPFIVGDHGEKILDPHHLCARKIFDRGFVDGDQLGANCRRPDHARMHHVR